MTNIQRTARLVALAFALSVTASCSQTGGLGQVLGSVLGGGAQDNQLSGTIRSVDTRNQQISIQPSSGQAVAVAFDNQTKVVYQNQNYAVTSLEYGDQVTARIQQTQNGAYYTDLVQVDQSVQNTTTSSSNAVVQSLQGVVRRVDATNGWFEIDAGSTRLTVSLPYNATRTDQQRFQNLRIGDSVRFTGVYLNNTRVELRSFY
ncbi:MAG: hypothetical protein V4550_04590 [Gemmatimonadota bacterium]